MKYYIFCIEEPCEWANFYFISADCEDEMLKKLADRNNVFLKDPYVEINVYCDDVQSGFHSSGTVETIYRFPYVTIPDCINIPCNEIISDRNDERIGQGLKSVEDSNFYKEDMYGKLYEYRKEFLECQCAGTGSLYFYCTIDVPKSVEENITFSEAIKLIRSYNSDPHVYTDYIEDTYFGNEADVDSNCFNVTIL